MARICMVVHEHYPKDFRVRREAEALAANGHQVLVLALRSPGEARRERCGDVDVLRLPVRRHRGSALAVYLAEYLAFFLLVWPTLTWLQLRRRFEIVHVHTPPDVLVFAALVPRLLGAAVVIDVHDRMPELFGERFRHRPAVVRTLLLLERVSLRFATRVITVHEPYAQRLARQVPAERIDVIFNAADEGLFTREPGAGRAAGTSAAVVRLLHHGTLMHRYGADVLVEAVHRLPPGAADVRLDVLGDGDLLPYLRELVRARGLDGRVVLHGHRSLEEVADWIRRADLCIVPNRQSPFTDGILPTKLLEYVALGRPVIATRTETLSHYFSGASICYVPSGDADALAAAIAAFVADPEPFRRRAAHALEEYEPLRWPRQSARLNAIVTRLTA